MRTANDGAPAHDFNAGIAQRALVDAVQARDLAVLVGEQRLPVEAGSFHGPAEGGGDLEVLAKMRRVAEQLFRDAADVAAGAAPYREEVVVEGQVAATRRSNTSLQVREIELHQLELRMQALVLGLAREPSQGVL